MNHTLSNIAISSIRLYNSRHIYYWWQ